MFSRRSLAKMLGCLPFVGVAAAKAESINYTGSERTPDYFMKGEQFEVDLKMGTLGKLFGKELFHNEVPTLPYSQSLIEEKQFIKVDGIMVDKFGRICSIVVSK